MSNKDKEGFLNKVEKEIKKIDNDIKCDFHKLFKDKFIKKHTKFNNSEEFFKYEEFNIKSDEDLKKIPKEDWDCYVKSVSDFENWEDMMASAASESEDVLASHVISKSEM